MITFLTHIENWFTTHRPELTAEERRYLSQRALSGISPDIKNYDIETQVIYINEELHNGYGHSAYNLVKNVFEEHLPVDYAMFYQSPIFFELIDGILEDSVLQGLFPYKSYLVSNPGEEDPLLATQLLSIIKQHIS